MRKRRTLHKPRLHVGDLMTEDEKVKATVSVSAGTVASYGVMRSKLSLFVVAHQLGPGLDVRIGADDPIVVDDLVVAKDMRALGLGHAMRHFGSCVEAFVPVLIDTGAVGILTIWCGRDVA